MRCTIVVETQLDLPPLISVHDIEGVVPSAVCDCSPHKHLGDQMDIGEVEQTVPALLAAGEHELLAFFFTQDRVSCNCRTQVHKTVVRVSQYNTRSTIVRKG